MEIAQVWGEIIGVSVAAEDSGPRPTWRSGGGEAQKYKKKNVFAALGKLQAGVPRKRLIPQIVIGRGTVGKGASWRGRGTFLRTIPGRTDVGSKRDKQII